MTSFFEHQRSSYKRNYLRNLIFLASSDGNLDEVEKSLIVKIGLKRGLKEWQIQELLEDKSAFEVFLPESMANRMNLLFDLMLIIYADGHVSDHEVEFLKNIIERFNLPGTVEGELFQLFQNGTPTPVEWVDYVDHVLEKYSPMEAAGH